MSGREERSRMRKAPRKAAESIHIASIIIERPWVSCVITERQSELLRRAGGGGRIGINLVSMRFENLWN